MTSVLQPDPWKALGVERSADKSEIRSAYKKLVLQCHPDKVQDPTLKAKKQEEFQKVQEAYELLNDDAERAKYEQKLKLVELQRAASKLHQDVKRSPNTSAPRTPTTSTKYATYDIRTAEPTSRYRGSPSSGKVYTHSTTTHTRSHEEVPSSRVYPLYEEPERQARRSASYEKPSKRDEERRERDKEDRRRRKEDEELGRSREKDREREREREREKEREARKAEKKRAEKEREKARRRDADEKAGRHKPYVEPFPVDSGYVDMPYMEDLSLGDDKYVSSRSKEKRSSSRKHDETRERERERERDRDYDRERERERDKSSSRRNKSPHGGSDRKHVDLHAHAASYITVAGNSIPAERNVFWKSQHSPDSFLAPTAPTPPPAVDFEEESIRRAARAATRRPSNDAARSREKLTKYDLDPTPSPRPIPSLKQSYSTPPPAPESPPRVSRSQTTPHEAYVRTIPSLQRTQTWAAGVAVERAAPGDLLYEYHDSDDDRADRRHRRSRRTRSPSAQAATHRYKVQDGKTTKLSDPAYVYGESPKSGRRYAADVLDGHVAHSPSSTTYAGTPFRVKEARTFGPGDVKYSDYNAQAAYYSPHGEGYPVMA